ETQMDGKQRERYARALEKLRKEIRESALRLLISKTSFIILGQDEETKLVSDALAMAVAILEDAGQNGSLANAEKVLLETYSSDGYLRAMRPLIEKIRYVAYAPYWASRSSLDEETGQYTNAIISHLHREKMVYLENIGAWYGTGSGFCFWDLPPTMPEIRREYETKKAKFGFGQPEEGLPERKTQPVSKPRRGR
ncbi:MAG: hypothetical protein ACSW8H_03560, partial [bacterium]